MAAGIGALCKGRSARAAATHMSGSLRNIPVSARKYAAPSPSSVVDGKPSGASAAAGAAVPAASRRGGRSAGAAPLKGNATAALAMSQSQRDQCWRQLKSLFYEYCDCVPRVRSCSSSTSHRRVYESRLVIALTARLHHRRASSDTFTALSGDVCCFTAKCLAVVKAPNADLITAGKRLPMCFFPNSFFRSVLPLLRRAVQAMAADAEVDAFW